MKNSLIIFIVFLTLLSSFGCSGLINRAHIQATTEESLLKAGFKSLPITQDQLPSLSGFPAGQITSIQRHGTIYYIYPDFQHDRFLMGSQEDYARYHLLVTQQLTPMTQPSGHLDRDWVSSGFWKN